MGKATRRRNKGQRIDLATLSLDQSPAKCVESVKEQVAKATNSERKEHAENELFFFGIDLKRAYDLVTVKDIYEDLAARGIVHPSQIRYGGEINFIVYPKSASGRVKAFWGKVMRRLVNQIPRPETNVGVLLGLLSACGGNPISYDVTDLDTDAIKPDLLSLFSDADGAGVDKTNPLVEQFGPIVVHTYAATSVMEIASVQLPRAIAVDVLSRFTHLIQPFVAKLNARRAPAFNVSGATSVFNLAAQTVPHFLGRKCSNMHVSSIYKTIRELNMAKDSDQPEVRRSDVHVSIMANNVQCTAAVQFRAPLNLRQVDILRGIIDVAAGNRVNGDWLDECLL